MNNKNPDIANEQALLINFIKDSERTQEDTLKIFQEKVENIVSRGIDSGESANDEKEALSKAIGSHEFAVFGTGFFDCFDLLACIAAIKFVK